MLGAWEALCLVYVCVQRLHGMSFTAQWSEGNSVALCSYLKGRISCLPQAWDFWDGQNLFSPHLTWLPCHQQSQALYSSPPKTPSPVYLGAPWARVLRWLTV